MERMASFTKLQRQQSRRSDLSRETSGASEPRSAEPTETTTSPTVSHLVESYLASPREGAASTVWQSLGFDSDDPMLNAARRVRRESQAEPQQQFDVMLSYQWGSQDVVLLMRDWLEGKGLQVWMDVDQMAGDIYHKMAQAVASSRVVVPCLTPAYESSPNCRRELGYAADQRKRLVPVLLTSEPLTWSALITSGLDSVAMPPQATADTEAWAERMERLHDLVVGNTTADTPNNERHRPETIDTQTAEEGWPPSKVAWEVLQGENRDLRVRCERLEEIVAGLTTDMAVVKQALITLQQPR